MADKFWFEIAEYFPFVKLDVHVVFPNHVHGIILIDKSKFVTIHHTGAYGNKISTTRETGTVIHLIVKKSFLNKCPIINIMLSINF